MRSFSVLFVGVAFADETCSDGTCAQDEATLLQMHQLRQKVKASKTRARKWGQYEVDNSKCNNNVDLVCADSYEDCLAVAETNGHPWFSFRHNQPTSGECAGQHKCFSSASCSEPDALIGDRTNEWNIYGTTWEQYEVDNSKCNLNENLVCVSSHVACQQVAEANGHQWYSFRHNQPTSGECAGEHKCFSSSHCDEALIGDRTNEWNIYSTAGKILGCPGSDLRWDDQQGADVRCCTMDGSARYDGDNCNSGYLNQNFLFSEGRSCGAGDCNGNENAWCHDDVSFEEAQQICAANGERLCTRAEIENRDCCGTGCMHNFHLIWYSDVLGSTATGTTSDGCLTSNYEDGENPTTAQTDPSAEGAVRCCGDDGSCTTQDLPGSETAQIYGIDGSPVTTQACHTSVTYDAARGICSAAGLRLCTVAELDDGRCCGTGCWNDHRPTWVSA